MNPHRLGFRTLIACIAVTGAGILTVKVLRDRQPFPRLIAAAQRAPTRPIEGRLAGFPYRPKVLTIKNHSSRAEPRLRGIAASVLESGDASSNSVHERGIAQLLRNDAAGAVQSLQRAVLEAPRDAAAWSDLSAAFIDQARLEDSPQQCASALAAANHAIAIDPRAPTAQFNRATALDHLGIVPAAIRAYEDYLLVDPSGGWADEARMRTASLHLLLTTERWENVRPEIERRCIAGTGDIAAIVRRFPQEARTWGEGVYLAEWGDEAAAQEKSSKGLRVADCLGKALEQISGEKLLAAAVSAINSARPETREALAAAHVQYRNARILYSKRHVEDALLLFKKAEALFRDNGSPMHFVAVYYQANAAIDERDFVSATSLLAEADKAPPEYRALRAQTAWARGLTFGPLGRPYEALSELNISREIFERLGERENALQMSANTVHLLTVLGRNADAWRARTALFLETSRSQDGGLLDAALFSAAESEANDERWDPAAALYREDASLPNGAAKRRAEALVGLAIANWKGSGVPSDLSDARTAAMKLPSETLRQETFDAIRYAEARFVREQNPRLAITLLERVAAFRRSRNAIVQLPAVYEEMGRAWRALGDDKRAATNFQTAIEIVKEQNARLPDLLLRDSFTAAATNAYEELIDLCASRGDYPRAFEIAEESRTAGPLSPQVTRPANSLTQNIPRDVAIIGITTLRQGTCVTLSMANGFRGFLRPISRVVLTAQVDALRDAIARDDLPRINTSSEELFKELIEPVAREIAGVGTVIFVPDEAASRIPFALLRNPVTHSYLVEHFSIVVAPSVAFAIGTETKPPMMDARALVVGDPAFKSSDFPQLQRLPGALEEAQALASLYHVQAIVGTEATSRRIVPLLSTVDVIDFAGHVLMNPRDALTTAIPLAPGSADDSGALYLRDIARMRFRRRPVVVLAGCDTGSTASSHGSIKSLADAFLTAGSRAVAGTLWNVDDDASRNLSLEFHRALLTGLSPAASLRTVQLSMLQSINPNYREPRSWAGFQLYGNE